MWTVERADRIRRGTSRARQAAAILRTTQPIVRLASAIVVLDRAIPHRRGNRRELLLGYMGLVSDWRSGRRSRPGRTTAAQLVACTEERIRQLWREDERLGLITQTAEGTRLPHETVRNLAYDEYRIADRAEWTVLAPAGVYAEDVTSHHIRRAVAILAELADRFAAIDADLAEISQDIAAMGAAWQSIPTSLDKQEKHTCFGAIHGFITSVLPSRNPKSPPCTADGRKTQKTKNDTATRWLKKPSSDKSQGQAEKKPKARRPMSPDLVALARNLRAETRLPQLRGCNVAILANTIKSRAAAGWTVHDFVTTVEAACQARQRKFGYYDPPIRPGRAISWLKSLLEESGVAVEMPPHITLVEAAHAEADRIHAARHRREAEAGRQELGGPGHRMALAEVRAVALRRAPHRHGPDADAERFAARRQTAPPIRQEEPALPSFEELSQFTVPTCEAGCGTSSPDVESRWIPGRGTVLCCEGCHAWRTRPGARYER